MEFKIVERKSVVTDIKDELVKNLIALGDNEALEVTLDPGASFVNWQSTLRNKLRKHNRRLRISFNKGTKVATCWTELLDE